MKMSAHFNGASLNILIRATVMLFKYQFTVPSVNTSSQRPCASTFPPNVVANL